MLSDEQIGERIRALELEEEYLRELVVGLGFDPAHGFTEACIHAIEHATLEQRRGAALRTLALKRN